MKYRTRIYYTEEQKAVMWDRWQKGDSLHSIARLFERGHGSIADIELSLVNKEICFLLYRLRRDERDTSGLCLSKSWT